MVIEAAKQFIDYIYDELVRAPAIEYYARNSIISRGLALRYTRMYQEDVLSDLAKRGIEPLDEKSLVEYIYALYDGGVTYVGKGVAGAVFVEELLPEKLAKNVVAMLHTHPIPLPIPTPEDLASAANLGYLTECVAAKARNVVEITCVSPKQDWKSVVDMCTKLGDSVLSVRNFVVVKRGGGVVFVPMPTPSERRYLVRRFVELMQPVASVEVLRMVF